MTKRYYNLSVLILALAAVIWLSGCLKLPQQKDTGPKRTAITSSEIQNPKIPKQAHKSIADFVKSYLQTAFLDLNLAKKTNYKHEITSFFDEKIQDKTEKDWQILSLGEEGKILGSISQKRLKFKSISIYSDELRNTSLSMVDFVFEAEYKADFKPVSLTVTGNFSLYKDKEGWKIISYKLKQNLHSKRENESKS